MFVFCTIRTKGKSLDNQDIGVGINLKKENKQFPVHPSRLVLYSGYQVSFPGVKRLGHAVGHATAYTSEVTERVELYFYFPSGLAWHVLGRTVIFVSSYYGPMGYVLQNTRC